MKRTLKAYKQIPIFIHVAMCASQRVNFNQIIAHHKNTHTTHFRIVFLSSRHFLLCKFHVFFLTVYVCLSLSFLPSLCFCFCLSHSVFNQVCSPSLSISFYLLCLLCLSLYISFTYRKHIFLSFFQKEYILFYSFLLYLSFPVTAFPLIFLICSAQPGRRALEVPDRLELQLRGEQPQVHRDRDLEAPRARPAPARGRADLDQQEACRAQQQRYRGGARYGLR